MKILVVALIEGDTEQFVTFEAVRGYAVGVKVTSNESRFVRLFAVESVTPTVIRFVLWLILF